MARNSIMPVGSDPFGIFDPFGWDRWLAPVRSVAKPAFASVKCDVKETDEGYELASITGDTLGIDVSGAVVRASQHYKGQERTAETVTDLLSQSVQKTM